MSYSVRHPRSGYSLIELLVAISILATAVLLMIGLFVSFLNSSQKSVDLTGGTVVASSLLNQEVYQVTSDNALASTFWTTFYSPGAAPFASGSYPLNSVTYFYNIYCQDVEMPARLTSPTNLSPINLKRMDIVVWWWNSSGPSTHQGEGRLQVESSRLMWPSAPY